MKILARSIIIVSLTSVLGIIPAAHGEIDSNGIWHKIVEEESIRHSQNRFWETGISGIAVFSIGVYGANFDSREFVTSSIYAVMQSGGIILMSQSLKDYLGASSVLTMDSFYQSKQLMSRKEMQYIVTQTKRINEHASAAADLFLWSGLSLVYLQTALKESKSDSTTRSLYLFLSANSGILAGASAFKIFSRNSTFEQASQNTLSFSASGQGIGLLWKRAL